MSGVWGNKLKVSIFGESHGPAIGVTLHNLPAGIRLDEDAILKEMARRAPGSSDLTTPRKEKDQPEIVSGYLDGQTTGAPLTAVIWNTNTRSKDYNQMKRLMRPGQADYPGRMRYDGFADYRGSGHFSGRITAPLVFAGAIAKGWLAERGIRIGAHVLSIEKVYDRQYTLEDELTTELLQKWASEQLPLFEEEVRPDMEEAIYAAKQAEDSVGGVVETIVSGVPAGYGNPFFDSVEATLAHLIFSVPATKGLEFGSGFDIAAMRGSQANDAYYYDTDGNVKTKTNHNGGIIGGITYGMPIVFRTAIKPPASIGQAQETIDIESGENTTMETHGRHDPCIVPRVIPVLEAVTALALMDLILVKEGIEFAKS